MAMGSYLRFPLINYKRLTARSRLIYAFLLYLANDTRIVNNPIPRLRALCKCDYKTIKRALIELAYNHLIYIENTETKTRIWLLKLDFQNGKATFPFVFVHKSTLFNFSKLEFSIYTSLLIYAFKLREVKISRKILNSLSGYSLPRITHALRSLTEKNAITIVRLRYGYRVRLLNPIFFSFYHPSQKENNSNSDKIKALLTKIKKLDLDIDLLSKGTNPFLLVVLRLYLQKQMHRKSASRTISLSQALQLNNSRR